MKKNCHQCRFLEFNDADNDPSTPGWFICDGREESEKLHNNLQREEYRDKSKVCYIAKSKD